MGGTLPSPRARDASLIAIPANAGTHGCGRLMRGTAIRDIVSMGPGMRRDDTSESIHGSRNVPSITVTQWPPSTTRSPSSRQDKAPPRALAWKALNRSVPSFSAQ